MASRPRPGPNSHRQRSRDIDYSLPPLSPAGAGTGPSLRTLNSPRDRDRDRDRDRGIDTSSIPPSAARSRHRLATWSAVARRAERIRSLDERSSGPNDDDSLDQMLHSSSRRAGHVRNSAEAHSSADLDDIRSLDEANSHLRALLDLTTHTRLSPLMPPTSSPPPVRFHDYFDDNRRSKRRKLDAHRSGTGFRGFRYGRFGQVEAGHLRMEIVSCDGGIFSNEATYAAENILKNDTSVYCTKGNRCNVVLRHQGGTVFTLQELVIKAPARTNYSHPVREGMVFIAMDQDDTLNRTAQYQIQYVRPRRNRGSSLGEGGGGGGAAGEGGEGGRGDDLLSRHVISIRYHDDDSTTTTRARRSFVYQANEDDENRVPQMPREFAVNLPDFHVTTECSDDEEDDVYNGTRPYRGPPNIGSLPFENEDSDSEDNPDPFNFEDPADDLLLHHSRRQNLQRARVERERERLRDRERDLAAALHDAYGAHAPGSEPVNLTDEAARVLGEGDLLTPHARFFIEKRKSKCTIKFDPPVSGRFILLKMWGSQHDSESNIDIQSVITRGFAGPRYFPAVDLR